MARKPHNPRATRPKSAPDAIAVDDAPAVLLLAANQERDTALLANAGPNTVYVGKDATVTADDGIPLASGQSLSDTTSTDAWYGICAAAETADVRVLEV